jgi:hypothetical protein
MKLWPDIIQGSEEWFALRELRPTASQAKRVITPEGKDGAWPSYVREMIDAKIRPRGLREAGAFTGNRHTDRGNENEPLARARFERETGYDVVEVGFVTRDDGVWGCSPDGLVMQDQAVVAGIEIKCPDGPKHLAFLDAGKLPPEYACQIHCSMVVTGFPCWWFMSFCQGYQPLILRAFRDGFTAKMEDVMNRFQRYYESERRRLLPFADKQQTEIEI